MSLPTSSIEDLPCSRMVSPYLRTSAVVRMTSSFRCLLRRGEYGCSLVTPSCLHRKRDCLQLQAASKHYDVTFPTRPGLVRQTRRWWSLRADVYGGPQHRRLTQRGQVSLVGGAV